MLHIFHEGIDWWEKKTWKTRPQQKKKDRRWHCQNKIWKNVLTPCHSTPVHTVSHWLVSAKLTEQRGIKLHSGQASTLTAANHIKKLHSRLSGRLRLRLGVAMELRQMRSEPQLHTVKIHKCASLSTKRMTYMTKQLVWQQRDTDEGMAICTERSLPSEIQ